MVSISCWEQQKSVLLLSAGFGPATGDAGRCFSPLPWTSDPGESILVDPMSGRGVGTLMVAKGTCATSPVLCQPWHMSWPSHTCASCSARSPFESIFGPRSGCIPRVVLPHNPDLHIGRVWDAWRVSARARLAPGDTVKPVLPRAPAHIAAGSHTSEGGCGRFGSRPLPGPVGAGVGLVCVCYIPHPCDGPSLGRHGAAAMPMPWGPSLMSHTRVGMSSLAGIYGSGSELAQLGKILFSTVNHEVT